MAQMTRPSQPDNDNRTAAFDAALVAYLPGMRKLAYTLVGNKADDLVQDTAVAALRRHGSFRTEGGFRVWVSLIMRSIAAGERKKYRPHFVDGFQFTLLRNGPSQEIESDMRTIGNHLHDAGGHIILRRAQGEELKDIAVSLGVSKNRASLHEARARAALIERFGDYAAA